MSAMAETPPVLITTATRPPEGVYAQEMRNVATRKVTAKGAALFWAALGARQLVIADATGSTLLDAEDLALLTQMGVTVEQIAYQQDPAQVIRQGKGYGEGCLLEFALESSALIRARGAFFKCTGKMFCKNFADIATLVRQYRMANLFWSEVMNLGKTVDTRFFYSTTAFCREQLIPAYKTINDRAEINAERVVFEVVSRQLKSARAPRPLLIGFAGGTNGPHFDGSLGALDSSFPCWVSEAPG